MTPQEKASSLPSPHGKKKRPKSVIQIPDTEFRKNTACKSDGAFFKRANARHVKGPIPLDLQKKIGNAALATFDSNRSESSGRLLTVK